MVSIRRRKLLGLYSGRNSFLTPLPKLFDNGKFVEDRLQSTTPTPSPPMPSVDANKPMEETTLETGSASVSASASANVLSSNLPKEEELHQFPEVKRRKRHRRKQSEHHEQCVMRGVYFKNMKWQAAIKVDKKQIHLGTVGSQEEAARLYDRAAFMCGREPNFELSEEDKQALRKCKWEEFLSITRSAITNKKQRRKNGATSRGKSEPSMQDNEWEDEEGGYDISASEELEPDASVS